MTQINLRALPSLREYPNDELKLLATAAPAREYEAGAQLCKEGDPARSCYLLATGSVEIRKHTPDGERVLATLKAGAIVGQMALVDRSPRSATVQAAEPTIALELTRDVFEDLLRSSSPLALRFQEHIAVAGIRQLRLATQRLASLASSKQGHAPSAVPEQSRDSESLLTVQAALSMWDMSLEDLDKVRASTPDGAMSAEATRARTRPQHS